MFTSLIFILFFYPPLFDYCITGMCLFPVPHVCVVNFNLSGKGTDLAIVQVK